MPTVEEIINQLQSDAITDNQKDLLDELKQKMASKQYIPSKLCIDDICISRNELALIKGSIIDTIIGSVLSNSTGELSQYKDTDISDLNKTVIDQILDSFKSTATDNLDITDNSQPPS